MTGLAVLVPVCIELTPPTFSSSEASDWPIAEEIVRLLICDATALTETSFFVPLTTASRRLLA